MSRGPNVRHRRFKLQRSQNDARDGYTPRRIKRAAAVVVEFAIVEQVLRGDHDLRGFLPFGSDPADMDRVILDPPAEFKITDVAVPPAKETAPAERCAYDFSTDAPKGLPVVLSEFRSVVLATVLLLKTDSFK